MKKVLEDFDKRKTVDDNAGDRYLRCEFYKILSELCNYKNVKGLYF
jgi:hypothetical protein